MDSSKGLLAPRQPRILTVRIYRAKARFCFNTAATEWFHERAITRISVSVDPMLKSVSVQSASPNTKSLALTFTYLKKLPQRPVQAIFASQLILRILDYKATSNSTFIVIPSEDRLRFIVDQEYELRPSITLS